ncbi:amidohydrolase family protein [Nocardiopsis xinjiangensis]|uniref:amidohydrolase family protein n=1 Tax=Nocardiopsis xinjiangensis TaxID=124285 RepID=UPI000347AB68|nr:amidohydrolase family protein [Nocardiopsis xinjiangensis]
MSWRSQEPRLYTSGPLFTTPGGHPIVTFGVGADSDTVRLPSTAEEAREAVRELATGDDPVDLVKVVQERGDPEHLEMDPLPEEVLEAVVAEAHGHGLFVTAHCGSQADLADALAATEVGTDPALHRRLRERLAELHGAGGWVLAGSDAAVPGVPFGGGLHRELELLSGSGMGPHAALRAATVEAARVLGTGRIGTIAAGRAADLLAVAGDPLSDITAVREVSAVYRDGRPVVKR